MQYVLLGYLAVCFVASGVSFLLYGWDKWQARRGGWRIPERTLHIGALLGGWPGAWIGQRVFRHKTQKRSFRIGFWLIVALHVVVLLALGYLMIRAALAEAT